MLAFVIAREIPAWVLAPFVIVLAGVLGWAVRWVLRVEDR